MSKAAQIALITCAVAMAVTTVIVANASCEPKVRAFAPDATYVRDDAGTWWQVTP